MQVTSYNIYSASAGSGKTFTLVREYLKIILTPGITGNFRQLLAITFTNKAVNEMKQRILGSLFEFSQTSSKEKSSPLFQTLRIELGLTPDELQERAKKTLKLILHNYAFFDVSTIDKFTHRIIRTFARDLKLPQNFEVVLDTDLLLDEAVGRLISKVGFDEKLTSVLIDFALEKIEDDKSWDVSIDLNNIGRLLFNENHLPHLKKMEGKRIDDFLKLKERLGSKIRSLELEAIKNATAVVQFIDECGLESSDFPRETLPNHFKKIREGFFGPGVLYNNKLEANLTEGTILKSGIELPSDEIAPVILDNYLRIKEIIYRIAFLRNAYNNSMPLTILNALQQEVKTLEKERDQLPITSFNGIISNAIKNQPAPFIYERLGEKYRHYFIDEFQDTSELQWNNLIPLISNALESEDEQGNKGSLLLVGDAKQAIYRWRGGKAEQFLGLCSRADSPFVITPEIENLPLNYRSKKEIVVFNNAFFTSVSSFLNSDHYKTLFIDGNQQDYHHAEGGLVQLDFLEGEEEKTIDELYCEKVLQTIREVIEKSYAFGDICILTRKRKHGILVSDFLLQNGIPLISSETLLLKSNRKVKFLIQLLWYCAYPEDLENAYGILYFLGSDKIEIHDFIQKNLEGIHGCLLKDYSFDLGYLKQVSVYDGLEYAIKQFGLAEESDAYLTFLLDEVLLVEQREDTGITAFLNYWEKKRDKLSIVAPENMNAVQIMTVHKAKGLEFPIVIFPYANTHIYEERNPKLWLPVRAEDYNGFGELLTSKKQEVAQYGPEAGEIYGEEQQKLELDAFNLLYVALTRAINALFVISEKDLTSDGSHREQYYSGLFIHYLKERGIWDVNVPAYSFGSLNKKEGREKLEHLKDYVPYQYSYKDRPEFKIIATSGALWDTDREEALSRGTRIHRLMEMISTSSDVDHALNILAKNGVLGEEEKDLRQTAEYITDHPDLNMFFQKDLVIKSERDIITEKGLILRPDRLVFQGKNVSILDYKTGRKNPKHHEQLYAYADALEAIGYQIEHKVIVYIDKKIQPEFI